MKIRIVIFFIIILWGDNLFLSAQQTPLFQFPEGTQPEGYAPNTIIVKYTSSRPLKTSQKMAVPDKEINSETKQLLQLQETTQMYPSKSSVYRKNVQQMGERTKKLSLIYKLKIGNEVSLEQAINLLRNDPAIEYAEPLYIYQPLLVPNDPLVSTSAQYHLTKIQAFDAWDISTGDPSMLIGITDNGFDVDSDDLKNNAYNPATNNDLSDNDNNVSGGTHGNQVALCAAAVPNNATGTAGTGYNCQFLPIKVAPNIDLNAYNRGYDGMLYAAGEGAKVINLSWGRTGQPSQYERDIVETVFYDYDIVLVGAAGNDGNTQKYYPASYEVVLSVAATNANDNKASFSTYNDAVDISAPGEAIVVKSGGGISGTSYATPLVAGAAALVRHHLGLNAAQTVERLRATADDISGVAGNESYAGMLGTGRLNMFRALSDPLITIPSYIFDNTQRGYVFGGTISNLTMDFKNHVISATNLTATLSTTSSYIQITDNSSVLGTLNAYDTQSNASDPFTLQVDASIPANTIITFDITYTSDAFTYTDYLTILLNPGYSDINKIDINIGSDGTLANYDRGYAPLSGLTLEGQTFPFLREAGLMIGVNSSQVSDAVSGGFAEEERNFTTKEALRENISGDFMETEATFEDITNHPGRIGLEVKQKTYAWNETDVEQAVVVEYQITNVNIEGEDLVNVYAGIFANWDIDSEYYIYNRANWDNATKLGYVYNLFNNRYAGIVLLTDTLDLSYYAFDENSAINIFDGFSEEEKFTVLSLENTENSQAGMSGLGSDIAHCLSAKIQSIPLGETETVAFALVAGTSLGELQQIATAIQSKFQEFRKSPVPVVTNQTICKGESILITPGNGSTFHFYNTPPSSSDIFPIATGSSLNLANSTFDQTIYVTGIDSLYESDPVSLDIKVLEHEAAFTMNTTKLDLKDSSTLSLQSITENAVEWTWEIFWENEATSDQISFIENTKDSYANPKIIFLQTGSYEIKLTSKTKEGCVDSTRQSLLVLKTDDTTTGIEAFLQKQINVYPIPASQQLYVDLTALTGTIQITLMDNLGRTLYREAVKTSDYGVYTLPLNLFPQGNYFLKIETEDGWIVKQITKQS